MSQARKLYNKGQTLDMMDSALRSTAVPEQVALCVHIGLLCSRADPKMRPDMKREVVILSKKPSTLEEPSRPGIPGSRYRRRAYEQRGSHYSMGSSPSNTDTSTTSNAHDSSSSAHASSSSANNTVSSSKHEY